MKRVGNLFKSVVEPENLKRAFLKASRGKRARPDQRAFMGSLEEEVARLRSGLLFIDYPVGDFTRFIVLDIVNRCKFSGRARVLTRRVFGGWGQPPSRTWNTLIISGHDNKIYDPKEREICASSSTR